MPTVETTSPIEVEVNATTESPTINLQIDGYLRSELYVVDIVRRNIPPSGGTGPFTWRWEFSATANDIAYAATHGKKVVGHRITSTSDVESSLYSECLFGGVSGSNPVSVTFEEISSDTTNDEAAITTYTATGDSNIATVETVVLSSGGSGGISSLLVTFTLSGNEWTADKTFAEVTAAVADGVYVYATDSSNTYYTLVACDPRPNDGAVTFTSAGDLLSYGVTLWNDNTVDKYSIEFATEDWVQNGYQPKSITDTGGYFTTDTVEGALQEIGAELAGINTLIGSGVIT